MAFAPCPPCLLGKTDLVAEHCGTSGSIQRDGQHWGLNPTAAISWAGGEPELSTEPPAAVGGLLPFSRSPAVLALSLKGLILPLPPALGEVVCMVNAEQLCPAPLCHAQASSGFTRKVEMFSLSGLSSSDPAQVVRMS